MEDRFKHNVEKLFVQICGEDIRSLYVSRGLIPDYEITVDREKYLDITKSKLKHFVHILQYFDHNARCTLVDLVPDELGKDLLSLMARNLRPLQVHQMTTKMMVMFKMMKTKLFLLKYFNGQVHTKIPVKYINSSIFMIKYLYCSTVVICRL